MGNKNAKPQQPEPEQTTQETTPNFPKDDDRDILYNILKEKYLETKEIEDIIQRVKPCKVNHPLIVCISTKKDKKIFKEEKEISDREYIRIIQNEAHRDIKKQITDILNADLLCDEPKYDGLIVLLFCVCFVSLPAPDNNNKDKKKKIELKFFYDENEEGRHVEKLKKDIIYRLDDMFIQANFEKSAYFYEDLEAPNKIGIVSDLSELLKQIQQQQEQEKKKEEKEEKEEKKDGAAVVGLRPSPQMEQSNPNGTVVLWSKPPTIPEYDDNGSDDALNPQKDSQNKPQTNTDIKEEEAD